MNLKAAGAHARGLSTMTDTGRVSKQRSRKAMDALDRASSRKSAMQLKRPHQGQQQLWRQPSWQSNRSREGSIVEDEQAKNDALTDGVQLMMQTIGQRRAHKSQSTTKHIYNNPTSGAGHTIKKQRTTACPQVVLYEHFDRYLRTRHDHR